MDKVEKFIPKVLLKHGFTQEELDTLSLKQIKEIYSQGITHFVQNFSTQEEEKQIFKPSNPFKDLQHPEEIFDLKLDFLKYFTLEDIILIINKQFRQIPMEHIQKIVAILLFSFQENILEEIRGKLTNISENELESIMEIYEAQRDNIKHLTEINEKLELGSFREKFESILNLKSLIQNNNQE